MCTVSWHTKGNAFTVLFNRDERRERQDALPPSIHQQDGMSAIYPVDPVGKGTWLAVNEAGRIFCLLNYYDQEEKGEDLLPDDAYTSRGQLILSLVSCETREDLLERLLQVDMNGYRPFHLLFLSRGEQHQWTWDTCHLSSVDLTLDDNPVTTSSLAPEKIIAQRKKSYHEKVHSLEDARRFHYRQDPAQKVSGVRMQRGYARTVSISELRVIPDEVSFTYDNFTSPPQTTRLSIMSHSDQDMG